RSWVATGSAIRFDDQNARHLETRLVGAHEDGVARRADEHVVWRRGADALEFVLKESDSRRLGDPTAQERCARAVSGALLLVEGEEISRNLLLEFGATRGGSGPLCCDRLECAV